MKTLLLHNIKLLLSILLLNINIVAQNLYFPPSSDTTWETISPTSLGWCTSEIDTLFKFLASTNTKAFLVLKDGRIAIEQYFGTFTRDSLWYWASAGKTLTAFVVGIAQQEGFLRLSDATSQYLGVGWTSCPPDKERLITIEHQLTMTSGLNDTVPDPHCTLPSCLQYLADAGTRWAYHNAPYTLLHRVVENATGLSFNQYFAEKIKNRIGMNGLWVPSGYNTIYISNARSMARFGLLMLNHGIWNTDTLMRDTSYFRRMTNTSQSLNLSYGYLTWLNGKDSYMLPRTQFVFPGPLAPHAPLDMYAAIGKNGQILNVIPSQQLVVVRLGNAQGSSPEVPTVYVNKIWRHLNRVICNQTAVEEGGSTPNTFAVLQNYPNPFNPTTTIRFSLPQRSHVTLKVFDILGKEVATLVDGDLNPGEHSVVFNATKLPSGVYFYRLNTSTFSQTKRMEVLK